MKRILFFLLTLSSLLFAATPQDKLVKIKEQELSQLKSAIQDVRDSLQFETARRYTLKQQLMQRREADKEEFEHLREQQERTSNQLSQVKEEVLAKDQQLSEEHKLTADKQAEWGSVVNSLGDIFNKEAASLAEAFPSEREQKQAGLEAIRRMYGSDKDPSAAWKAFALYKVKYARSAGSFTVKHERLALEDGPAVNLVLARFGSVFAYGVDTAGTAYVLRQTGRLGADRYALSKIGNPELASFVNASMPLWLKTGLPCGTVLADVLQNEQSKLLIAGKKVSWWQETIHSFKQGGAVMIPLLLLPFWVLFLVGRKAMQIFGRKNKFSRQFKQVMTLIDKSDFGGALEYTKRSKGAMARILQTCIEYRQRDRHGCERVVREIIYHEIPVVNRSINTVAVIAGAAPLLGLLGTISGMITLFSAVTHFGTGDPKFLAGGISEALITAKTGLAIAIPALFFHDWLRSSKESLVANIEEYAAHTMNRFWPEG